MKPTIRDVARRAGVSVATVSRVLNQHPLVAAATRHRVEAAIQDLDYQPNEVARSLVRKETRTVGLVIPDISNPFFPKVVRGVEDMASRWGYTVILSNTDQKLERELALMEVLQEKQVDGILFMSETITPEHREAFRASRVPVVLVATVDSAFPSVGIDNRAAAREAVEHLLGLGHRRIAMISGPTDDLVAGWPRIEGYEEALAEAGIAPEPELIRQADYTVEGGARAMARLLKDSGPPDAVFAASDTMAVGALNALSDAGWRVPYDVAVVGFDDIPLASVVRPRLTTIAQPTYEMGARAMELLRRYVQGERVRKPRHMLPHRLVIRESCGASREAAPKEA